MIKKLYVVLLCLALSLGSCAACAPKEQGGTPTPPPQAKPVLIFEIDEGIRDLELIGQFADDFAVLDAATDRIRNACAPLKEKYDVVYHVYAHYHYRTVGFSGDASLAENRLSPELKHFMQYMSEKGEKVLIEAYSSGVGTHQSGALDRLPLVPVHYGDAVKIGGFTMDVECLAYLADTYSSFYGVRFHELIGSDNLGGNAKPGELYGTGFKVSAAAVEAVADTMAAAEKVLVWGDHSWDVIYGQANVDDWLDMVAYAIDQLGENLVINYSNNSWDAVKSLEMKPFLKASDTKGAAMGFSVQTWFWQESDTASYQGLLPSTKWYKAAFMDMPPELMAASTLTGIKNGARVIQYEPPQYFFNAKAAHVRDQEESAGYYESEPDYSPRPTLGRFVDLLLGKYGDDSPSTNTLDYYTSGESKLDGNLENDPPDKYFQTTLGVIGKQNQYYDTYNYRPSKLYRQDDNRYRESVFADAAIVERINLTFGGVDETLVVKRKNGTTTGNFYYYNSTDLHADGNIFADNEFGQVIDVAAANLVRSFVSNLDNDPDELVVARKKDDTVTLQIYKAQNATNNSLWAFTFALAGDSDAVLADYGLQKTYSADTFVALSGYRFRNALHGDGTRSYDSVGVITKDGSALTTSFVLKNATATEGERVTRTFKKTVESEIVDICSGDMNQDRVDEILLLIKTDAGYRVRALTTVGNGFDFDSSYDFVLEGNSFSHLFTTRVGTYYKQSLFLSNAQ